MNRARSIAVCVVVLLITAGCSSPKPAASNETAPAGVWSGEYGQGGRQESIRVDLRYEGSDLRGTLHAGVRSMPLTKVSYAADSGAITMEFDAEGPGGRAVHYVVEGKVSGDRMEGSWTHDDQRGEFRVTKQE